MNLLKDHYRPLNRNEKIEVAFLFQAGTVWPSWDSIYEELIKDSSFLVRIILLSEVTVEQSHQKNAEKYLIQNHIDFVKWEDINKKSFCPHIVFVQFPYDAAFHTPDALSLQFRRKGCRVVYIPYGIELSDIPIARRDHFCSRVVENAWRVYTSCDGIRKEYDKYCRNRIAVRATGSPKFDSIFHKNRFAFNDKIKSLASGRKIVVWKMHFPKKSVIDGKTYMITPDLDVYISFASDIERYDDLFFVVLPHPKMVGQMVDSDIQGDNSLMNKCIELIDLIGTKENAFVDTDDDYRSSLYNADAVIIDRSGTIVEAASLGVPLLFMKNASFSEPMTPAVKAIIDACHIGSAVEDMKAFIEDVRNDKTEELCPTPGVVENQFPYFDGKCGARIVNDIKMSLYNEKPDDALLNVVLYGTGEVASYYMNNVGWALTKEFRVVAVIDSYIKKRGCDFYGYSIECPEAILEMDFDVIVIMTEPHFYEMQKHLVYDLCISDRKILRLDEFVYLMSKDTL